MFSTRLYGIAVILFVSLIASGLGACSNPAEEDDHDEHAEEIEGVALVLGGDEVVTVLDAEVEGSLEVAEGEKTGVITVEFLDHDGEEVHADELDDEFSLDVVVQGSEIVTVEQPGRWTFELQGDEAGDTAIRVLLLHDGHADFTTPDIPVKVE